MDINEISSQLAVAGIQHVVVSAKATKPIKHSKPAKTSGVSKHKKTVNDHAKSIKDCLKGIAPKKRPKHI